MAAFDCWYERVLVFLSDLPPSLSGRPHPAIEINDASSLDSLHHVIPQDGRHYSVFFSPTIIIQKQSLHGGGVCSHCGTPFGGDSRGVNPNDVNPSGVSPRNSGPHGVNPSDANTHGTAPEGNNPVVPEPRNTHPAAALLGIPPDGANPEGVDPVDNPLQGTNTYAVAAPLGSTPEDAVFRMGSHTLEAAIPRKAELNLRCRTLTMEELDMVSSVTRLSQLYRDPAGSQLLNKQRLFVYGIITGFGSGGRGERCIPYLSKREKHQRAEYEVHIQDDNTIGTVLIRSKEEKPLLAAIPPYNVGDLLILKDGLKLVPRHGQEQFHANHGSSIMHISKDDPELPRVMARLEALPLQYQLAP